MNTEHDIYLAGALFSEAERRWNLDLCRQLEGRGWRVFLPQRDSQQPGEVAGSSERAEAIFQANLGGLKGCRVVVAVLEGAQVDDGTSWEVGFAYASGTPVFAIRTDFRGSGDDGALNLMLSRSAHVCGSVSELLEAMESARSR